MRADPGQAAQVIAGLRVASLRGGDQSQPFEGRGVIWEGVERSGVARRGVVRAAGAEEGAAKVGKGVGILRREGEGFLEAGCAEGVAALAYEAAGQLAEALETLAVARESAAVARAFAGRAGDGRRFGEFVGGLDQCTARL